MPKPESLDLMYNHDPVCPHCGKKYGDAWEIDFHDDMEGLTEITCGTCEKEYMVQRNVEITFTTFIPNPIK